MLLDRHLLLSAQNGLKRVLCENETALSKLLQEEEEYALMCLLALLLLLHAAVVMGNTHWNGYQLTLSPDNIVFLEVTLQQFSSSIQLSSYLFSLGS